MIRIGRKSKLKKKCLLSNIKLIFICKQNSQCTNMWGELFQPSVKYAALFTYEETQNDLLVPVGKHKTITEMTQAVAQSVFTPVLYCSDIHMKCYNHRLYDTINKKQFHYSNRIHNETVCLSNRNRNSHLIFLNVRYSI